MTTNDQARERMTQQRQHDEHLQEAMRERAEESIQTDGMDTQTAEKAREQLTQERQHEAHVQQSMHDRAEAEIHQKSTDSSAQ